MWRLIKFIFTGTWHEHEWKIIDQRDMIEVTHTVDRGSFENAVKVYTLQCEHCGDIEKRIL